jgi:hypothetical protein
MAGPPTFPLRHFRSALAADYGWAIAEWLSRYCPTCLRVAKFRPLPAVQKDVTAWACLRLCTQKLRAMVATLRVPQIRLDRRGGFFCGAMGGEGHARFILIGLSNLDSEKEHKLV